MSGSVGVSGEQSPETTRPDLPGTLDRSAPVASARRSASIQSSRSDFSFAWLGRNRRFSKDYEYRVQTSETKLDIAAMRLMVNRLVPA